MQIEEEIHHDPHAPGIFSHSFGDCVYHVHLADEHQFTKDEEQRSNRGTQFEVEKIARKVTTSRTVSVTIASSLTKQAWLEWAHLANKPIMGDACKPTIYTPIGFAMWRPVAEALGWPDKPIGWKTVVDLAMDPDGWATYGHPEWGKLRLGHPHPKYSSAGMLFLTSFTHGITGEKKNLSADGLDTQEVEAAFGALAEHTSQYGMVSTDLLRLMVKEGPRYLHAVSAFESDTIRFNLNHADELRFPLAFIFPAEGTFWSSHPYCILDQADWVSEEQAVAARIFLDHIRTHERQSAAVNSLLRPLHSDIPLHAPLDLAHGTDPRVRPETVPPLAVPSSEATSAITDLFMRTKRKATVLLVLDTSGSMKGGEDQSSNAGNG